MAILSDATLILIVVCTATFVSTGGRDPVALSVASSSSLLAKSSMTGEPIDVSLVHTAWNRPTALNTALPEFYGSPPTFVVLGLLAFGFWFYCLAHAWIEMTPVLLAITKRTHFGAPSEEMSLSRRHRPRL